MRLLIALCLLVCSVAAHAFVIEEPLSRVEDEQRAMALFRQVRCVVCVGQSLADSDAQLATDMRMLVRSRVEKGESDSQILDYLASRYGQDVLMKPQMNRATWALWFGPFVLLALGMVLVVLRIRRANSVF